MIGGYLDLVDALLGDGAALLSDGLRGQQAEYVTRQRRPDGGYGGRQGPSDLYYTDFALRTLTLAGAPASSFAPTTAFLSQPSIQPADVVECFSLLNCARLLARVGLEVPVDRTGVAEAVARQALAEGGYGLPGGGAVGAYQTFIAALCHELLGTHFPGPEASAERVAELQMPSGGFRGQAGVGREQTSTTAAVIGFLFMAEALAPVTADAACAFIAAMQTDEGGLRAHEGAPVSDLLSTFTGFLTLSLLDSHSTLDLAAVGRFVRSCGRPGGGFSACPSDPEADVEYTYYGLACVALLRAIVDAR